MNPTPHGKISRLPHVIREQTHSRLRDGEKAAQIIAWLNSLPEVQQVLATEFSGRPITERNLSRWKQFSHSDWLLRQEVLAQAPRLLAQSNELSQAGQGELTDHLATVVSACYAAAYHHLGMETDQGKRWKFLRAFCRDLVVLRRGDHRVQWMRLQREQLAAHAAGIPARNQEPP